MSTLHVVLVDVSSKIELGTQIYIYKISHNLILAYLIIPNIGIKALDVYMPCFSIDEISLEMIILILCMD